MTARCEGRIFPPSAFCQVVDADSSICEKCLCVFESGLRYLTSGFQLVRIAPILGTGRARGPGMLWNDGGGFVVFAKRVVGLDWEISFERSLSVWIFWCGVRQSFLTLSTGTGLMYIQGTAWDVWSDESSASFSLVSVFPYSSNERCDGA